MQPNDVTEDEYRVITHPRPLAVFVVVENCANSMAALCRIADYFARLTTTHAHGHMVTSMLVIIDPFLQLIPTLQCTEQCRPFGYDLCKKDPGDVRPAGYGVQIINNKASNFVVGFIFC